MSREWTEEQKAAASERMKARHEATREASVRDRVRIPLGLDKDVTAVHDTPDGYVDYWVNDKPGRVEKFRRAGYETVEKASVGHDTVDGTHANSGIVTRDMGQGVTAVLMRQRREHYDEDQAAKQRIVDRTEDALRRSKTTEQDETGYYGEVKIGR